VSWDISIIKLQQVYESVTDIPADARPLDLGSRQTVHEAVLKVFSDTDWSDPAWGRWEASFGSVGFNLGGEDPATSMMLHVRAGTEVVPLIVRLCRDNGWQGFDCSTGNFIERSAKPEEGLEGWIAYRNQVIKGGADDA
jgi:hypothetical protein